MARVREELQASYQSVYTNRKQERPFNRHQVRIWSPGRSQSRYTSSIRDPREILFRSSASQLPHSWNFFTDTNLSEPQGSTS